MEDETNVTPSTPEPKLRDPSVYENAQYLIAVGIVGKVWKLLVAPLVVVLSIVAWFGYDLKQNRDVLFKDIEKTKEDIERELKDIEKTKEEAQQITIEMRSIVNKLKSQQNDFNGQLEAARALPNQYIKTISDQSNIIGMLTEKTSNQLKNSEDTLKQLSDADDVLLTKGDLVNSALTKLEEFQEEIKETLEPFENKVFYSWDGVLLSETEESIEELGLFLYFKEGDNRSITEVELRNKLGSDEPLCSPFKLKHKDSIDVRTPKGVYSMTNRYSVDGLGNRAFGLRFERLDSEQESDQDRRTC